MKILNYKSNDAINKLNPKNYYIIELIMDYVI